MKKFNIFDMVSGNFCCQIETNNGKNAIRKFRDNLLSSGIYWIGKEDKYWHLYSSYGSDFVAHPTV